MVSFFPTGNGAMRRPPRKIGLSKIHFEAILELNLAACNLHAQLYYKSSKNISNLLDFYIALYLRNINLPVPRLFFSMHFFMGHQMIRA